MEKLQISTMENGGYAIAGKTINIKSEKVTIVIDGEEAFLCFGQMFEEEARLGNTKGKIIVNESLDGAIQVRREVFISTNGDVAAVRVLLKNTGEQRINLSSIETMRIADQSSFIVGDAGIDKWKVLRYPFHNFDIPSYYRPTVVDKDFTDAAFSCFETFPGKGVQYNLTHVDTRTITSGPVMMVKNLERPELPILMFSTLGIEDHFILMSLTTTEDRKAFQDFNIVCDFDEMAMDPGDETATHWLMITTEYHEGKLLQDYTDMVSKIYGVRMQEKPSFTVYCTWYFYTYLINEQYVLEELESIREREIPIDVFQIDDGWMDTYGMYEPNAEVFPGGMKVIADKISELGIIPGIWVAPFIIDTRSPIVQKYPDIYQKDKDGNYIIFHVGHDCYVLDPTAKDAKRFLQELFTKLKGWGYKYFKMDWLRAIYEFSNTVFQNPKFNRSAAYYFAMRYIREIIGDDSYILACGGLSDPGNIGLVNGNRTSKDVRGVWNGPEDVPKSDALIQMKQNLLRSHINHLYDSDPDATQIRIRKEPFSEKEEKCVGVYHSEGRYTDDEALTICTHQYLCGGMVTISERFSELQESRLAMLRHISPAITRPAYIVDYDTPECPTLFLNNIEPSCKAIGSYWTLTIGNWEDISVIRNVKLRDINAFDGDSDKYAIFEFHTQRLLGVFSKEAAITVEVPAHGVRVLRIAPWDGNSPILLGTDLHITGGAAEIKELTIETDRFIGKIETRWQYPVTVTAGFPLDGGIVVRQSIVPVGENQFEIREQVNYQKELVLDHSRPQSVFSKVETKEVIAK